MKFRMTGLALAAAMVVTSITLPAFAAAADGASEEQTTSPGIYLDGELADVLEFRLYNSVNYITVESFMALMDQEAVVEEADGVVAVNAASVAEVVDVEEAAQSPTEGDEPEGETDAQQDAEASEGQQAQEDALTGQPQADEGQSEESQAEEGQGEEAGPEETPEANVVEETLNFTAAVGQLYVVANGRYLYVKDGVLTLEGKVAVPVRTLAAIFNLAVGYDGTTGNVTLTSQEGADAYLTSGDAYYNGDTLYWLSRIINAESGNQPMTGKIAVGNVVMNRVASPLFPDTIYDVLFQRNQFSPAISGSIYRSPNAQSIVAAKLVMEGAVVYGNALFFNAAGINSYASRNRPYVGTIGGHSFYA